jgi:hypothetical protein
VVVVAAEVAEAEEAVAPAVGVALVVGVPAEVVLEELELP